MADSFSSSKAAKTEGTWVTIPDGTVKIPWTGANTFNRPVNVPFVPDTTPQPVSQSCAPGRVPCGTGACKKL
jgi:hypothetical protein